MVNDGLITFYYFCSALNASGKKLNLSIIKPVDIRSNHRMARSSNFDADLEEQWYQHIRTINDDISSVDINVKTSTSRDELEDMRIEWIAEHEKTGIESADYLGFDYYNSPF